MLDIAYRLGASRALEDFKKEAFWKMPLLGAMADSAYSNILDDEFDGNQVTPLLRGALTGTGAGLGWAFGGRGKLLTSALGGAGSHYLANQLSQRG
jgi:hypothetical protein